VGWYLMVPPMGKVEVSGDLRQGELVAMNVGRAARDGESVQPVSASQG